MTETIFFNLTSVFNYFADNAAGLVLNLFLNLRAKSTSRSYEIDLIIKWVSTIRGRRGGRNETLILIEGQYMLITFSNQV